MAALQAFILVTSAVIAAGQRPSFAGTRPIGYPELLNKTTTTPSSLQDKFGEVTTQRLPIEALGDRELIDRISKLPVDKQPFWFINWQALEAHRQKPETYPLKPSPFLESNFQTTHIGALNNPPASTNTSPSFNLNPPFANPNSDLVNRNPELTNPNVGVVNPSSTNINSNSGFSNPNIGFVNPSDPNANQGFVNTNSGFESANSGLTNSNRPISNVNPGFNSNAPIANFNPGFTNSNPPIASANPSFTNFNPSSGNPNPGFISSNPSFVNTNPSFVNSNPNFVNANPGLTNPDAASVNPNSGNIGNLGNNNVTPASGIISSNLSGQEPINTNNGISNIQNRYGAETNIAGYTHNNIYKKPSVLNAHNNNQRLRSSQEDDEFEDIEVNKVKRIV